MADPVCPICNGEHWLYEYEGEEVISKACICLERKLLRDYLGPEISNVKRVKSDLYCIVPNTETGKVEGDRTEENLFIKGSWAVVCQHLHWVLSAKRLYTPGFSYKIIEDNTLVNVWLGKQAYLSKSTKVRDEIETNNTIADLVLPPSLVLIRLGFRITPNKATPKVLHEALKTREFAAKPTWIIEGAESFLPGQQAFSDAVNEYIQGRFKIVDVGGDVAAEREENKAIAEETEEFAVSMGLGIDTPSYDETFELPQRSRSKFFKKPRGGGMGDLE